MQSDGGEREREREMGREGRRVTDINTFPVQKSCSIQNLKRAVKKKKNG